MKKVFFLNYGIIVWAICSLYFISCNKTKRKEDLFIKTDSSKTSIKYAKGFDIQIFDTYKKLIIKSPYPGAEDHQEFILIRRGSKVEMGKKIIEIPLEKIVATSTTHIPMLELIEEENSLIGFPHVDYINSSKTTERIKNGLIKDIGNDQDLNTEVLLDLQPNAVIAFSMGNTTKMYETIEKNGIPVIFNGDWLEETPLGRAEWIKFFGALYDKEKEADSIFSVIELAYNNAKQIARNSINKPTIMSGVLYKDKWNLPAGESFTAQLYRDANTNYYWKESKGQGSLVLSFEAVYEIAKNADFWIGSGYFTSFSELASANNHYTEFNTYKNKNIYTFSKKRGENGGVIYFEMAPIQPHIVLQDLIKIVHPELLPEYKPYFLEKLE